MGRARLLGLALVTALASCDRVEEPPPREPARPVERVRPPSPAAPAAETLQQRIARCEALEKQLSPRDYRARHGCWRELLEETRGTRHETSIRERLEAIEGEANRACREAARPVMAAVREILAERRPAEAKERLLAWSVPSELDPTGSNEADRRRQLAMIEELIALEERRAYVASAIRQGDAGLDPERALSPFLGSRHVHLRAEAEWALRDLRRLRALDLARRRLARVRPSGRGAFGETPLQPVAYGTGTATPPRVRELYAALRPQVAQLHTGAPLDAFARQVEGMRRLLDAAVDAAPWFPVARYHRAECRHALLGDTDGAMADLGEAVRWAPDFVEARLARIALAMGARRWEEAEADLRPFRFHPWARHLRALARCQAGRHAEAAEDAVAALRMMREPWRKPGPVPSWSGTVELETEHYVLRAEAVGDGERVRRRLRDYAEQLEAARATFARLVPVSPHEESNPAMYVFASHEAYHEYADDLLEQTAGVCWPNGRIAVQEAGDSTVGLLVHEAFHAYLHECVPDAPRWLHEGLAEVARGGDVVQREHARALALAGEPDIEALLESDFASGVRAVLYAHAWSLAHMLRARHAEVLDRYMQLLAAGVSRAHAHRATLGRLDLRREWTEHVDALR